MMAKTRLIAWLCVAILAITLVGCGRPKANPQDAYLVQVMPSDTGFTELDADAFVLPDTVTRVFRENSGQGHIFELITTGYSTDMVILCGVNANGRVTGAICVSSNETLGKEADYGTRFVGKSIDTVGDVDTINGATKTTAAYKNAIRDALNAAAVINGNSVNIGGSTTATYEYEFNDATLNWGAIQIVEGGA